MAELQELRDRVAKVSDTLHHLKIDEKILKRYLRAFRSVNEAYKRLLATNKWRGESGVAKLTSDTPSIKRISATGVSVILQERDVKGRPVALVMARNHSIQKRDIDDMVDYIVYTLDLLCSKCQDDGLDSMCIVFDMRNFSLMCMDYPALKYLFQIMSDHFPERLGVCLVVNSPLIFNACWLIIRAWIDENTASKIQFVKLEELSEHVDPSILPLEL